MKERERAGQDEEDRTVSEQHHTHQAYITQKRKEMKAKKGTDRNVRKGLIKGCMKYGSNLIKS